MNSALEYLKSCGTFFLATDEGDQPHVRPFGAVCEFENRLYIVTNNQKKVYQQMKKNGKVEICGMYKGTWIRVEGEVREDLRRIMPQAFPQHINHPKTGSAFTAPVFH